jgi:hypothetical protein
MLVQVPLLQSFTSAAHAETPMMRSRSARSRSSHSGAEYGVLITMRPKVVDRGVQEEVEWLGYQLEADDERADNELILA